MPGLAAKPAPVKTSSDGSRPSWISAQIIPQAPVGVMQDSARRPQSDLEVRHSRLLLLAKSFNRARLRNFALAKRHF